MRLRSLVMAATSVMGTAVAPSTQARVTGRAEAAAWKGPGCSKRRMAESPVGNPKVTENVRLSPGNTAYFM